MVAEHDHQDDPKGVWHLRQSADAAQGGILVEEKRYIPYKLAPEEKQDESKKMVRKCAAQTR